MIENIPTQPNTLNSAISDEYIPQAEKQDNKVSSTVFVVSLILSFIVFGATGYYLGTNKNSDVAVQTPDQMMAVTATPMISNPSSISEDNSVPDMDPTDQWQVYNNTAHSFSLKYPSSISVKETDGVNIPLVYLDSKPINIPDSYDGQLTPIEIRTSPIITEKTVEEAIEAFKSFVDKGTFTEKKLAGNPNITLVSGNTAMLSRPITQALIQGKNEVIQVDYSAEGDLDETLILQIISSIEVN